jgi:hypothetical protein
MGKKMVPVFLLFFVLCIGELLAQTAEIDNGGKITVMAAKEVPPKGSYKPSDGMKFVAFDILIDNIDGSGDIKMNLFLGNIEVKDSQGYSYTPKIMTSGVAEPNLDVNGIIERGDNLRGWMTIEINKEEPVNKLRLRLKTSSRQSGWVQINKVKIEK